MTKKEKLKNKIVSCSFMILVLPTLFFTSKWVNKDLKIQFVIENNQTQQVQSKDETKHEENTDTIIPTPIIEDNKIPVETDKDKFEKITKEQMLKYLNKKYKEDFEILEYSDGGILDNESMRVYPKKGSDLYDIFSIKKLENGEYEDDYLRVYAKKRVKTEIDSLCKQVLETPYYINISIEDINAESKEDIDTKEIKDLGLTINLEILTPYTEQDEDSNSDTENDVDNKFKDLLDEIIELLQKEEILGNVNFKEIKINNFDSLTDYSFSQYNKEPYIKGMASKEITQITKQDKETEEIKEGKLTHASE